MRRSGNFPSALYFQCVLAGELRPDAYFSWGRRAPQASRAWHRQRTPPAISAWRGKWAEPFLSMARASQVGLAVPTARAELGPLPKQDRRQASTACPTCGLTANSTTSGVLSSVASTISRFFRSQCFSGSRGAIQPGDRRLSHHRDRRAPVGQSGSRDKVCVGRHSAR